MSTTTQELDAERWHEYFDSLTPSIEGMLATIEVMDAQAGDQLDAERPGRLIVRRNEPGKQCDHGAVGRSRRVNRSGRCINPFACCCGGCASTASNYERPSSQYEFADEFVWQHGGSGPEPNPLTKRR